MAEPPDNENWRYGPNTIMVNIRNIVDPTMTHILGALLKARTENVNIMLCLPDDLSEPIRSSLKQCIV